MTCATSRVCQSPAPMLFGMPNPPRKTTSSQLTSAARSPLYALVWPSSIDHAHASVCVRDCSGSVHTRKAFCTAVARIPQQLEPVWDALAPSLREILREMGKSIRCPCPCVCWCHIRQSDSASHRLCVTGFVEPPTSDQELRAANGKPVHK